MKAWVRKRALNIARSRARALTHRQKRMCESGFLRLLAMGWWSKLEDHLPEDEIIQCQEED